MLAGNVPHVQGVPVEMVQDKNWFARNWKWFVPVACLGLVTLVIGMCAATIFGLFGMLKASDAYKQALAQASVHPAVIRALGSPLTPGMFVAGSLQVSGSSGTADLEIPLSGPKGKGTLYVVARKSTGQWRFSTLQIRIRETGEHIDLLAPAGGGPPQHQVPSGATPGVLI